MPKQPLPAKEIVSESFGLEKSLCKICRTVLMDTHRGRETIVRRNSERDIQKDNNIYTAVKL